MKRNYHYTTLSLAIWAAMPLTLATSHAAEQVQQLPTIVVTAEKENTYIVQKSKAATKLDLTLKDTPQSVSVITSQQIEDQNLKDPYDILNQVPGVHIMRYGAKGVVGRGGEYMFYYARGKQIINYQIDGVMTAPAIDFRSGSALSNLDSTIFENVTVVKGAAGLTSGAGYPSASVSLNRKHATSATPMGTVKVSVGSWNNYRSEFDVQGGLNQNDTVRGRLVVAYEQGDSWKEWGDYDKTSLYGVIDGNLT